MSAQQRVRLPELRGADGGADTAYLVVEPDPDGAVVIPSLRDARACARPASPERGPCEGRATFVDLRDGDMVLSAPEAGLSVSVEVFPAWNTLEPPALLASRVADPLTPPLRLEGEALPGCRSIVRFSGLFDGRFAEGDHDLALEGHEGEAIRVSLHRYGPPTVLDRDRCSLSLAPAAVEVGRSLESPPASWPRPPLLAVDGAGESFAAWAFHPRGLCLVPAGSNTVEIRTRWGGLAASISLPSEGRDAVFWGDEVAVLLADRVVLYDLGGCPAQASPLASGLEQAVALAVDASGRLMVVQRASGPEAALRVYRRDGGRMAAPAATPGRGWYAHLRCPSLRFDPCSCRYRLEPLAAAPGCCADQARELGPDEALFFQLIDDLPGLRRRPGFVTSGKVTLGPTTEGSPLDAGRPGTQWHRVRLFGEVPEGCSIEVRTRAFDSLEQGDARRPEGWSLSATVTASSAGAVGSPGDERQAAGEVLVLAPPGRFLWVELTLRGTGHATPRVRSIEIEQPRAGIARFLPRVFQASTPEDDFLRRFLALFESTSFDGVAARMNAYAELFAPATAPERLLPYLASWLGLLVPEKLRAEPARLRELLRRAPELARLRGTAEGLRLAARLYLGIQIELREPSVARSRFLLGSGGCPGQARGPVLGGETVLSAEAAPSWLGDARLGQCFLVEQDNRDGALAHHFEVLAPAWALCRDEDTALLNRIVDLDKAAHTTYCIRAVAPAGWVVGAASVLGQALGQGYDATQQDPGSYGLLLLNGPPRPRPLERGLVLGRDSRLPSPKGPRAFQLEAQVGQSTRLVALVVLGIHFLCLQSISHRSFCPMTMSPPTTGDLALAPSGLSRLRYFFGQLLTQRDLEAEQRYHLLLRRLVQRESFGTGTVAGLKVEPAGGQAYAQVRIKAGLAMDPDGRELLLPGDACVTVAEPAIPAGDTGLTPPAGPITREAIVTLIGDYWGCAFDHLDVLALYNTFKLYGFSEVATDIVGSASVAASGDLPGLLALLLTVAKPAVFAGPPEGQRLLGYLRDRLVGTTFLGLRYRERGAEPAPAMLSGGCCETGCQPSRTEEGVVIVAQPTPLPTISDPYEEAKAALESRFLDDINATALPAEYDCDTYLTELIMSSWRGVPRTDAACGDDTLPVVTLARVFWRRVVPPSGRSVPAEERITSVDNVAFRRLAPGAPIARALLDALTECHGVVLQTPKIVSFSLERGGLLEFGAGDVAEVQAIGNGSLAITGGPCDTWDLAIYPDGDGTSNPGVARYSAASPPSTFTIAVSESASPAGRISIQFTGSAGMPPGLYYLRLNQLAGAHPVVGANNGVAAQSATAIFRHAAPIL